ncbi:RT0821/Lpp0805 family surface protein [Salinarimonas sp.]|uniref:RT0821/Lpp0805 family surface protein n=1 Tax=Salinarimonas sp. TaxID=2766526 RepID=UPI0032D8C26D
MPLPQGCVASGYRAKRPRGEGAAAALCVAAALAVAGCGTASPLDLLAASDPLTTGALPASEHLALGLHGPGLATARAARDGALAEALDPLGPGAPIAWRDPESGAAGAVAAIAGPTVRDDLVCRRFRAETLPDGRPPSRFVGEACRLSATAWRIEAAEPASETTGAEAEGAPAADAGLPADLMPDLSG